MPITVADPTVSVILTCKNSARTLERCLESILAQRDLKPIEVVVVDAGSTDGSQDIIRKFEPKGVRLIVNNGGGISENEILGETAARGDFIATTNSDVYVPSDWLERCYAWWEKGYDVVGGVRVNAGDSVNFGWNPLPLKGPIYSEMPEFGLTTMSTFVSRKLLLELPMKSLLESRDVELALMVKQRGLKLVIDPSIKVIHWNPLWSVEKSFRKSVYYASKNFRIVKMMHGKMVLGSDSGVAFSLRRTLANLLLINAVKTYMFYKPIMKDLGVNVGLVRFLFLREVFEVGQLFGVLYGLLIS